MAPNSVLAPWATVEDLPAGGPCTADTPEIAAWLQVASEILYNFTKRKYPGVGLDVIRPVRPCWAGEYAGTISSHITRGGYHVPRWLRLCSCGCVDSIELPLQPVVDVIEVRLDGVVLDPVNYRLDNRRELVRLDGPQWPACQRMTKAVDQPGTWEVSYHFGSPPPPGGSMMAATLGCQLALAASPDPKGCRLPKRVQTVTRQNVTMAVLDPLTLFKDGMTGLAEVDLWVAADARGDATRPAAVLDPMTVARGLVPRRHR